MIILDTNVISELLRPEPEPQVEHWLATQDGAACYLTTVCEAELRYGLALLPEGKKRVALSQAIEAILNEDFQDRILPFDRRSALAYAFIAKERRDAGRPISQFDAQIAAIARAHGASVATRNALDFQDCGIEVINPWQP